MVVKLHHIHLPEDLVLGSVLNRNRQIASIVESTELRRGDWSGLDSASLGDQVLWLGHRGHQAGVLTAETFTLE